MFHLLQSFILTLQIEFGTFTFNQLIRKLRTAVLAIWGGGSSSSACTFFQQDIFRRRVKPFLCFKDAKSSLNR